MPTRTWNAQQNTWDGGLNFFLPQWTDPTVPDPTRSNALVSYMCGRKKDEKTYLDHCPSSKFLGDLQSALDLVTSEASKRPALRRTLGFKDERELLAVARQMKSALPDLPISFTGKEYAFPEDSEYVGKYARSARPMPSMPPLRRIATWRKDVRRKLTGVEGGIEHQQKKGLLEMFAADMTRSKSKRREARRKT